jgi:carbonic anhydrase/acetyltransferase-like protein (isoleucine patch superfamily)
MPVRAFEGHAPRLQSGVYVDPTALVAGQVEIGIDSSVWPMSVVRGDVNWIRIGERTNIQDGCVLHVTHDSVYSNGGEPLVVGSDVTVGHRVILHACTLEDRCLIGMGTVVLDGAVVGEGAMIGAGALVPPGKQLHGGYLYLGSPIRRVRALTDAETAYLNYSAQHYVRLKNRHCIEGPAPSRPS